MLSTATARGLASSPAHSEIILRRTGISVAYTTPLMRAATPKCHGRSTPHRPRALTEKEVIPVRTSPTTTRRLRFAASDSTPMNTPVNSSGKLRAAETIATASPEPVARNVKRPAASTSSQSIAFATPPAIQSSLKPGAARSGAVTDRSIFFCLTRVRDADRRYARRRPRLPGNCSTAELEKLVLPHFVFHSICDSTVRCHIFKQRPPAIKACIPIFNEGSDFSRLPHCVSYLYRMQRSSTTELRKGIHCRRGSSLP